MEQNVKRSIVRISFYWKRKKEIQSRPKKRKAQSKKEVQGLFIAIPGVILSKEDESCVMIADGTFFFKERESISQIKVQLPDARGYGLQLANDDYVLIDTPQLRKQFCVFKIRKVNDFMEPVRLESTPVKRLAIVHAFSFGREDHTPSTPSTGYTPGSVGSVHDNVFFSGCGFHEFSHFGAPVFNDRGHLIGICYANQSTSHAWSVKFLREQFSKVKSDIGHVTFLRDGDPMGALGGGC